MVMASQRWFNLWPDCIAIDPFFRCYQVPLRQCHCLMDSQDNAILPLTTTPAKAILVRLGCGTHRKGYEAGCIPALVVLPKTRMLDMCAYRTTWHLIFNLELVSDYPALTCVHSLCLHGK